MRTDHQCLRALTELRAFIWGPVNDNGNVQINPLAASVFQRSLSASELLIGHTESG